MSEKINITKPKKFNTGIWLKIVYKQMSHGRQTVNIHTMKVEISIIDLCHSKWFTITRGVWQTYVAHLCGEAKEYFDII